MYFKRKMFKNGESLSMRVPKDVADWVNLKEDSEIFIQADKGKHGKFVSFWLVDEEKKEE